MKHRTLTVAILALAPLAGCGEPASSSAATGQPNAGAPAPSGAPGTVSGVVIEQGAAIPREFIERDDVGAVQDAIRFGADVNAAYEHANITALHLATSYNAVNSLPALLNAGADPNAPTKGWTPLMNCVAVSNRITLATMLLDRGADPNHANAGGHTALMLAAHQGQADLLTLLLDRGADIHATNKYGATALHEAAGNPHKGVDVVQLLLDRGADPHAVTKTGETPRDIAASNSAGDPFIALLPE
ncbi:MAG: ankyrin repeat domain-containing protein [Phycisphaerales bacterium]